MLRQKNPKNKRGASEMIGYILLIVFAVIISVIVYQWLKTYVPKEPLQCSAEISLFIKEATFNSSNLNVTIKNNGKFNVAGYFIHAKNNSSQELPTIDLSNYLNQSSFSERQGINLSNFVLFVGLAGEKENPFKPGEQATHIFNIPASIGNITSIRIVPTIFKKEENRNRFVSCGDSRTEGLVGEPFVCMPQTCSSLGYTQCNPPGWSRSDGCGGTLDCRSCQTGFNCDASGECYPTSCTPVSNPCGTRVCGTATNGTCGQANCGSCRTGLSCNNATGQCVSLCGNGIIDTGEVCDDGNANSGDGCSSTCAVESGWNCSPNPTPPPASICQLDNNFSCNNACRDAGYSSGQCKPSRQCTGTMPFSGNIYCGAGLGRCCCYP